MEKFFLDLLTWVGQSPLRIVVIFVMILMFGGAWFVYTEKDNFMASYRAQQALPKMNGKYEEAVNFILKNTEAELVAVFEVNTVLNTRKLTYLTSRSSGHNKEHDGTDVGLLTKNLSNNEDVIGLMSGKIPCADYNKPQSYIGFTYKASGVNYMCRISVPAEAGLFIGQISVGWKEKPSDVELAQTVMIVASSLLYNKK